MRDSQLLLLSFSVFFVRLAFSEHFLDMVHFFTAICPSCCQTEIIAALKGTTPCSTTTLALTDVFPADLEWVHLGFLLPCESWGAGMVICLEQGTDLHMALPLAISCCSKSRLVLPFWYWLTRVVPDKGPLNGCRLIQKRTFWHKWHGLVQANGFRVTQPMETFEGDVISHIPLVIVCSICVM